MSKQLTLFENKKSWYLQQLDTLIKFHNDAIDDLKLMREIIGPVNEVEPKQEDELYDVSLSEAASILGVSDITVLKRLKHFKYIRDDKGSTWFTRSSLENYKARK